MSQPLRTLVVGGGIGGLSAVIVLRAAGHAVDLIERNPAWDVYGVGIIQPGNAVRAMERLGIVADAVAAGHRIVGDVTYTPDGSTRLGGDEWPPLVEGLPPGNGITRPRLHRILQDRALAAGVDVRTGVTATEFSEGPEAVEVAFSDGERRAYDLLVGADGIHSQVRAQVFTDAPAPVFTGQVCWRYNLPRPDDLERITLFAGPTGSAGFVPIGADLMYLLLIEKGPPDSELRRGTEGMAAALRERLAPFGGPVAAQAQLITDDEAVVYRPVEKVLMAPPWHRGRIVLIGDAAHATTPHCGQGAAQAMEDAIVLSEELGRDGSLGDRLAAYTDRRFERCRTIVEGSEAIGRWQLDHSLPINPIEMVQSVTLAAIAPL